MRKLILLPLLLGAAACAVLQESPPALPPEAALAQPKPPEQMAPQEPQPAAVVAAPAPVAEPAPALVAVQWPVVNLPVLTLPVLALHAPAPGRLLLANRDYPPTLVEAVITANPSCDARDEGYVSSFTYILPPQGVLTIDTPPGADVCWRRHRDPVWAVWNRALLAPGGTIDSTL